MIVLNALSKTKTNKQKQMIELRLFCKPFCLVVEWSHFLLTELGTRCLLGARYCSTAMVFKCWVTQGQEAPPCPTWTYNSRPSSSCLRFHLLQTIPDKWRRIQSRRFIKCCQKCSGKQVWPTMQVFSLNMSVNCLNLKICPSLTTLCPSLPERTTDKQGPSGVLPGGLQDALISKRRN